MTDTTISKTPRGMRILRQAEIDAGLAAAEEAQISTGNRVTFNAQLGLTTEISQDNA